MNTTTGLRARAITLGLVAMLSVAAGGCLFETRTPYAPTTGQCPLVVISDPDSVLTGLIRAMACRDSTGNPTGSANYAALLAPSFVFRPDPGDSLDFVSIDPSNDRFIQNWSEDKEIEVFSSLAASTDSINLVFTNQGEPGPQELQANYALTTYTHDDQLLTVTVVYDGQIRLRLSAGTNRIEAWDDVRGAGPSWGRLKLDIRQQIGT